MEEDKSKISRVIAGRYELRQSIGVGSFGEVFLAYDRTLKREVAIKHMFGSLDSAKAHRREREIIIHSQLKSKHIVSLHDRVEERNDLYVVLDLMSHSLAKYTKGVALDQVLAWARDCLLGLEDIHQQGVLHRDIKPSNIFIDYNNSARIGDFGGARSKTDDSLSAWTPQYVAPELIHGDQEKVGPSSDLYSLGYVIYQLLLGDEGMRKAFPEIYTAADTEDRIRSNWIFWHPNLSYRAPALHILKPEIPEKISSWVSCLADKDPAQRFQSAKEALEGLYKITDNKLQAELVTSGVQTVKGQEKKEEEKQKDIVKKNEKGKKQRLRKTVLYALAGVLGVVVILIVALMLKHGKAELSIQPTGIDSLAVEWKGNQVQPESNTQTYLLNPGQSEKLRIFLSNRIAVDTTITLQAEQKISWNLSGQLKSKISLSKVTFIINTVASVKIEGTGAKIGDKVTFELEPGLYHYEASAEGYETKKESAEISSFKDKDIFVSLERKAKISQQGKLGSKSTTQIPTKITEISIGDTGIEIKTDKNEKAKQLDTTAPKKKVPFIGIQLTKALSYGERIWASEEGHGRYINLMISLVYPNSPAQRAGLGEGDLIEAINEIERPDEGDFVYLWKNCHKGDIMTFKILRNGRITKESSYKDFTTVYINVMLDGIDEPLSGSSSY